MALYKDDNRATYDLEKGQYVLTETYLMNKISDLPEAIKVNIGEFCELISDIEYTMLFQPSKDYKQTRLYLSVEPRKTYIVNNMILLAKSLYVRKTIDSLFSDAAMDPTQLIQLVPRLVLINAKNTGIYTASILISHQVNTFIMGVDY